MEENIFLCGDFNNHVGMDNVGFEAMHRGYGFC